MRFLSRRLWVVLALIGLTLSMPLLAAPYVIYQRASAFNDIIVSEENGMRTMRFSPAGPRQSVVKLGDPDFLALPYAGPALVGLALCQRPARVLIIGLGGGTLPSFLRKHYPRAYIDIVEIDPDVVNVAKQYFEFREDSRMRVHVADGRAFVEHVRKRYDLIYLDAFGSSDVPRHLTTVEFLQAVRRAVKPSGVVVGNLFSLHNPLYESMLLTYQSVFNALNVLKVNGAGNRIVLSLPRAEALDREHLVAIARGTAKRDHLPLDFGAFVQFGYQDKLFERPPAGKVLRDAELP